MSAAFAFPSRLNWGWCTLAPFLAISATAQPGAGAPRLHLPEPCGIRVHPCDPWSNADSSVVRSLLDTLAP
jgi:hypothetical protein